MNFEILEYSKKLTKTVFCLKIFNDYNMSQQFFEHDDEIQLAPPNFSGIRNRFFLFMTYLKNSEFCSFPFSSFTLFVNTILNIIFSVYPIIPFITNNNPSNNTLYYFQIIFSPAEFWLLISFIIIAVTIFTFILCLIIPSLTIRLHWILNPQFHIILLPFLSLFFGFCPFGVLDYVDLNVFFDLVMFLLIIFFPFYLLITSFLFCFDNNSITKPNPIFAEWFYGFSVFFPLLNCITTVFNSIITHLSDILVYILSSTSIVLHLLYLILVLYKMPFILTIVNQFVATNSLFIIIMNLAIITIHATSVKTDFVLQNDWIFSFIPIIYTILFGLIYILSEKRRDSLHSFLQQQLDSSVGEFTVDAIRMTLSSYHSEQSIQWMIRDCFMSANKNILSQSFLQYCLELYPKSQWLISIVSFLYSILWSNNPNLYRILLHWLSLNDTFSTLSSYVIFQCVYCLMQSSKVNISPIIKRDIQKYRRLLSSYAQTHSEFWSSAANCDFKMFVKSISEVVDCNKAMKDDMNSLIVKYPYSPSVRLEASLFYSDILHDFTESAKAFQKYSELSEGKESVSKQLYIDFFNLFPVSKPFSESLSFGSDLEEKKKKVSDLIFISLNDTQEDATRYMLPPIKDKFYSLCQAFSIPKHKKTFEINFDQIRLNLFKYVFLSSIVVYIVMLVLSFKFIFTIDDKATLYETRMNYISETLNFRFLTYNCYLNSLVIHDYQKNSFNFPDDKGNFIMYVVSMIKITCDSMLKYNHLMSTESDITDNIDTHLPNCTSTNCTFSYIFGYMHNIASFYSHNAYKMNDMPEYSLKTLSSSVDNMILLTDKIYQQLAEKHCNSIKSLLTDDWPYIVSLLVLEIIGFVGFVVSIEIIGKNLYKNLFAIINTVPNSVLKEVASMFQKVELFIGYPQKSIQKVQSRKKMTFFYSISILMIFIYPLFISIIVLIYRNKEYKYNKLPDMNIMATSNSIVAAIYVRRYLLVSNYASITNQTNETQDFYDKGNKVWRDQFIDNDAFLPDIHPMKIIASPIFRTFGYIIPILSILSFFVYIIQGVESLRLYTTMYQLMRYIPERAWKANPVLKVLTKGIVVSIEKVEQLRDELFQTDFSQIFDLCSIQFQSNLNSISNNDSESDGSLNQIDGYFVEVKGNIDRFFGFHPSKISEIIQCLIGQMPESAKQIRDFFTNRPDQPVSVSFDGKTEVMISFSKQNKNVFLISDNNSHFMMNKLIRQMQRIKYPVVFKSEEIKNPFCAIINEFPLQNLRKSFNEESINLNEFFGFEIRDRRSKLVIIDRGNNVEQQKRFISLLKPLLVSIDGKCSICNEGSLFILGSKVMFPLFKGRAFGSCYQTAMQILGNLMPGQIAYPSSLQIMDSANSFIFQGSDLSISIVVT